MTRNSAEVSLDAEMESPQYRETLTAIDEQLDAGEVKLLKFLCSDVIAAGTLNQITSTLGLYKELESRQMLASDNYIFLAECLYLLQRYDLISMLGYHHTDIKQHLLAGNFNIQPFRILLYEISQALTSDEVLRLTFSFADFVPKAQQEKIQDATDLFSVLLRLQILNEKSVEDLGRKFCLSQRQDLYDKICKYREKQDGFKRCNDWSLLPASLTDQQQGIVYRAGLPEPTMATRAGKGDGLYQSDNKAVTYDEAQVVQQPHNIAQGVPSRDVKGSSPGDAQMKQPNPGKQAEANYSEQQLIKGVEKMEICDEELPRYKMTAEPRGICLIINNAKFYVDPNNPESKKMPARPGSDIDAKALYEIFEKLKFTVCIYNDVEKHDLLKLASGYASKDHTKFDCFVCCILSHGTLGNVYGANGLMVSIKDIMMQFRPDFCPTLTGKPKLFFIQACQGKERMRGVDLERDGPGDDSVTISNETDFLMGYATVPGYVSFRSPKYGTWYISKLVDVLKRYSDKHDLLSILTKVNEEVGKGNARFGDDTYKQCPAPLYTLTKRLYFH